MATENKSIFSKRSIPAKGDKGTASIFEQKDRMRLLVEAAPISREAIGYAPNPITAEISVCGPMNDVDRDFIANSDIPLFSLDDNKLIGNAIRTSTQGLASRVIKCPVAVLGLSLSLDVPPYVSTIPGVLVPPNAVQTPAITKAAQYRDGKTLGNALLDDGYWIDRTLDVFFRNYALRVDVGCDEVWLDIPLSVLGFDCVKKVDRDGNPLIGITEREADANAALAAQGRAFRFLAPNAAENCEGCPTEVLMAGVAAAFGGGACWAGAYNGFFPAPTPYMMMPGQALEAALIPLNGFQAARDQLRNLMTGVRTVRPSEDLGAPIVSEVPTAVVVAGATATLYNDPCAATATTTVAAGARVPGNLLYRDPGSSVVRSRFGGSTVVPATTFAAGDPLPATAFTTSIASQQIGSSEVTVVRIGCFKISLTFHAVYVRNAEAYAFVREVAAKKYPKMVRNYLKNSSAYELLEALANKIDGVGVGALPEIVEIKKTFETDDNALASAP